jgi:hypothetical protein
LYNLQKIYIAIKEKSAFLIFIDTDLIAVFICWEGLVFTFSQALGITRMTLIAWNDNPQKIKVKNQDKIDLLWCQSIFLPNMSNLSEIVKGIELYFLIIIHCCIVFCIIYKKYTLPSKKNRHF